MICSKCGAEIKEGCLFCPICGNEVVVVPDEDVLEDDYLKAILTNEQMSVDQTNEEKIEENRRKIKKRRYKLFIGSALSFLCLAIVVFVVIYVGIKTEEEHAVSYEYQVEKAQEAYMDGHLADAITYYKNAIALKADEVDLRVRLASIYMNLTEYDQAQVLYLETIQIDPSNLESYKNLISIYEKKEDMDSILALANTVSDPKILEVFSDYLVNDPIFSEESGVYENYLEIELFSNGENRIYYTTDNSDPVLYGELYTEPILYTSPGKYVIRAVCMNEKNIYSNTVVKEYKVYIPAPKTPVITPDGGEFSELTTVTITVPDGCSAYYTWDGSDPNGSSEMYIEPIPVPEGNNVLSVVLVNNKTGQTSSIYRQYFKYYP